MRKRLKTHPHGHDPFFFALHKLKAFTRFEQFPEMLLFAKTDSRETLVRDALDFFCYRFPPFVIALYNEPGQKLFVQSRRKDFLFGAIREFGSPEQALEWLRPVVQSHVRQRLEFSVEWKSGYYPAFFESQFVESRKNLRLQRSMMPKQLLDKDSVEYRSFKKFRRNQSNTRLSEFFFEKTPAENIPVPFLAKNGFKRKNSE